MWLLKKVMGLREVFVGWESRSIDHPKHNLLVQSCWFGGQNAFLRVLMASLVVYDMQNVI